MSNRIFTLKTVQINKLALAAFDKYFKETLCTQCKIYEKFIVASEKLSTFLKYVKKFTIQNKKPVL